MSASPRPPRLLPMLAGGEGLPSEPSAYQLEPKFDGQRVVVTVASGEVTLTSRLGRDATSTYPELAGLAAALADRPAVLDGEVVAFDDRGQPAFQRLQRRMHVARPSPRLLAEVPVAFFVFDLLWLDGELLIDQPQAERRRRLEDLGLAGAAWQTSPVLDADPGELLDACQELGLEGFMAKRLDAPYLPGRRSTAWSKVKCGHRREFVVGGWLPGRKGRAGSIGSLAVGCYVVSPGAGGAPTPPSSPGRGLSPAGAVSAGGAEASRLVYLGQVGSGLTEELLAGLGRLFDSIATPTSPFEPAPLPKGIAFVEPVLVVEVAYTGITDACTLRQPSLKGIRTDVPAHEVVVDEELAARLVRRREGG